VVALRKTRAISCTCKLNMILACVESGISCIGCCDINLSYFSCMYVSHDSGLYKDCFGL